jgi:hypothetical protein
VVVGVSAVVVVVSVGVFAVDRSAGEIQIYADKDIHPYLEEKLISVSVSTIIDTLIQIHTYRYTQIRRYRDTEIQTYRHTDIQTYRYIHTYLEEKLISVSVSALRSPSSIPPIGCMRDLLALCMYGSAESSVRMPYAIWCMPYGVWCTVYGVWCDISNRYYTGMIQ